MQDGCSGRADERSRVVDQYDMGQATYAIMLAATDLGIGTGHSSVGDQDKARAILGVPDDHFVAYLIGLGYPAGLPWRPSPSPTAAPWTRWYTAVAGSGPDRGRPGLDVTAARQAVAAQSSAAPWTEYSAAFLVKGRCKRIYLLRGSSPCSSGSSQSVT